MWLFPQHSCDIEQFFATLKMFEDLNGKVKNFTLQQKLLKQLENKNLYNPYVEVTNNYDTSTANHKIDEVRFYGGIYETTNHKLHLSTFGELLLKYQGDIVKRNKIFLSMLFNLQFPHPNKNIRELSVYPLRILFSYMLDEKINCKLSNLEIAYLLYRISVFKMEDYDENLHKILQFRKLSNEEKILELRPSQDWFIINMINCNYLFNILENLETINCNKCTIGKLKSSRRKSQTVVTEKVYSLKEEYQTFIKTMLGEMSPFEDVKRIIGLKDDWIREVYNTVSPLLYEEIGENDPKYTDFLQIPEMLKKCSANSSEWQKFEQFITRTFNLFDDVDAENIGGPGEPDTLGYYEKGKIRFAVEAKSTNKKLGQINDGRLRLHREKYSAEYTIIVTPSYRPSAVLDIKGTNSCIITSYCLADLVSKYIFYFFKHKMDCSFEVINSLILENLGTDVSEKIYEFMDNSFGLEC